MSIRSLAVTLVLAVAATPATAQISSQPKVLAPFKAVVAKANESTVQIRGDDKDIALGTVVFSDGFILTKASELRGSAFRSIPGRHRVRCQDLRQAPRHRSRASAGGCEGPEAGHVRRQQERPHGKLAGRVGAHQRSRRRGHRQRRDPQAHRHGLPDRQPQSRIRRHLYGRGRPQGCRRQIPRGEGDSPGGEGRRQEGGVARRRHHHHGRWFQGRGAGSASQRARELPARRLGHAGRPARGRGEDATSSR